jgi:hypothetical protein
MPTPGKKMDCFVASAPRKDDKTQLRDLAAGFARDLVCSFRPREGVGNAGCPVHPQPRVVW